MGIRRCQRRTDGRSWSRRGSWLLRHWIDRLWRLRLGLRIHWLLWLSRLSLISWWVLIGGVSSKFDFISQALLHDLTSNVTKNLRGIACILCNFAYTLNDFISNSLQGIESQFFVRWFCMGRFNQFLFASAFSSSFGSYSKLNLSKNILFKHLPALSRFTSWSSYRRT